MTDIITKCDGYFITKCDRSLLKNLSGFLLPNATEVSSKICQVFYYQMRKLLQNATFTRYCDNAFNEYGRFIQVTK